MTDPKHLRKYLLGLLVEEAETKHLEVLLLADEEFLETLLAEEDDLIDDFVDGTLSDEEREAFEKNFVVTKERREKILFAGTARHKFAAAKPRALTDLPAKIGIWQRFQAFFAVNRLATAAAFSIFIAGCFIAVWFLVIRPSKDDAVLASLNRAFQNERPVDARISGLDYAPFSERRGPKSIVSDDNALRRAENISRDAVFESETAETLHDLGKLQIAKREFAEAKKTIEKALAKKPDNPAILNELGIAELIAADNTTSDGEQLRLVATALEHFDKAVRLSPRFAEAWFNRAIAIGKLNVPNQEASAWLDYLKVDSTSKWADEARSRLTLLESQTIVPITAAELIEEFLAAYRQRDDEIAFRRLSENKEMITGKLVFQQLAFLFVDAEPDSDRSKELLSAMQYAADLELKKTDDKFWKYLADYYVKEGISRIESLRGAQNQVRGAYRDVLANRYDSAAARFQLAKEIFDYVGNRGESLIVDYWIAYLHRMAGKVKASRSRVLGVIPTAEVRGFTWLLSLYLSELGQLEYFDDNNSKHIEYDKRALSLVIKNNDRFQQKRLYESMALSYLGMDSTNTALEMTAKSLKISDSRYGSSRQQFRSLSRASTILSKIDAYAASKSLVLESFELNRRDLNEATFEYQALLWLAILEAHQGDYVLSQEYFELCRLSLQSVSEGTRERLGASLDAMIAHSLRRGERCSEALPLYERAAIFHDADEAELNSFDTHRGLLLCSIQNGQDDDRTARETKIVLDQLVRFRHLIRHESNLNSFFGDAQEVYDALIDFELARNNADTALEYAELSRARSLLDMLEQPISIDKGDAYPEIVLPETVQDPLTLADIRARLSPKVQLVVYSVLPDSIGIWVVSHKAIKAAKVNVDIGVLEDHTDSHLSSISQPRIFDGADKSAGVALYKYLISPIRNHLEPGTSVVIIPDKFLSKLPFGSLPSSNGEGFLIEDLDLQYAPSATIASTSPNKPKMGSEKLLAVGNPEFDQPTFGLAKLESGSTETSKISQFYSSNIILNGKDATSTAVTHHIRKADIFHFAGHYIVGDGSSLNSGMLLAGNGERALLRNASLVGLRLDNIDLAVLSACSTGSESLIDGEGVLGAARMFLAAGVPQVVATHWPVDSGATAELMISFHKNRKLNGLSTASALQEAQISFINSKDARLRDPYYWAPFFVFGQSSTQIPPIL